MNIVTFGLCLLLFTIFMGLGYVINLALDLVLALFNIEETPLADTLKILVYLICAGISISQMMDMF